MADGIEGFRFTGHDIIAPIDAALARTTNPFHRSILENHRRHVILEVCGRYEEIFSPDMTVAHPVYLISGKTGMGGKVDSVVFEGRDAVRAMYHATRESGAAVMCFADQWIGVCDWGIATEGVLHQYCPGEVLAADGEDVDDLGAVYVLSRRAAINWRYNDDALLIGERAYEDVGSRSFRLCAPGDIVTTEDIRRDLEPLLRPLPPVCTRAEAEAWPRSSILQGC